MFAGTPVTAIRPQLWPHLQPKPAPAGGARAAFFQAAKGETAAAAPQAAPAFQPVRVEPQGQAQPQKIPRPGSLLDIKV